MIISSAFISGYKMIMIFLRDLRVLRGLLDPSTEFILSAAERAQGMLFGKKHDLKKQSQC